MEMAVITAMKRPNGKTAKRQNIQTSKSPKERTEMGQSRWREFRRFDVSTFRDFDFSTAAGARAGLTSFSPSSQNQRPRPRRCARMRVGKTTFDRKVVAILFEVPRTYPKTLIHHGTRGKRGKNFPCFSVPRVQRVPRCIFMGRFWDSF